ncbi:hypothetical protein SBF1_6520002 [Candidatus Desulfosporosinus infrequens]|uniref:Uncharacterized protein n=1 Tax=Candidatus Desulfosporosinus infrequens TaxID=2043169 RepID=A0A2U3LN17_9FIRM|nr:hypothetical protein SBF1_6520002 [Candidatus Desulfosporosinus infrequens]
MTTAPAFYSQARQCSFLKHDEYAWKNITITFSDTYSVLTKRKEGI